MLQSADYLGDVQGAGAVLEDEAGNAQTAVLLGVVKDGVILWITRNSLRSERAAEMFLKDISTPLDMSWLMAYRVSGQRWLP